MMKRHWFLLSLIISVVLPLQEAEARKSRGGGGVLRALGGSGKDYGPNTLTVEQLKACLLLDEKIDASAAQLNTDRPLLEEQQNTIKQLDDEFSLSKTYIDENKDKKFDSQEQVDTFNQKVNQYNALLSEYNEEFDDYEKKQDSFNAMVENHKALYDRYKTDCADKKYYESDLAKAESYKKEVKQQ